ncbi:thioredoxin domain-containing protein [Fulvivirgaceae bacterium BMA12]|uniref:Thioredoxin domain-containing protein n=1 Tax=Agaribacillus aureus TaxID=3051825 RepID=A0ABT8L114_9BACT|nr:thioredoxin domain-containing protein [Fulvivirgaceae bacterium BMA12]
MKILRIIGLLFLFMVSVNGVGHTAINPVIDLEVHALEHSEVPKLVVVKFHADWCGSCKAMGPVVTDLTNKLDGQSVLFTQLDFTNNSTKHQSFLLASVLGIDDVVVNNEGTGFLLVIDGKTKQVKATPTRHQTVKEMTKVIADLL